MDFFQTISVPAIVISVYGVLAVYKSVFKNDKFNTFIPLLAALIGAFFGIMMYLGFPDMIPADNVCAAAIIGAASGWAATGVHQTGKQLKSGGAQNDREK